MAEPLKNLIDASTVRAAARHLQRAWPEFDASRFSALALHGLDELELKARAMQLCAALEQTLPDDFDHAAQILEGSLAPPRTDEDWSAQHNDEAGLAGWVIWPMGEFVARRGQQAPGRALRALHALTQRFTAEWAIRPFIEQHPAIVYATLQRWCSDPSAHVRRLVSEGSRPRLPWGRQLKALIDDPSPNLPLLRKLQDDASAYVRRSVANHLNDIAKDHPQVLVGWLAEHLPNAPATRRASLKHACRSLIKQGHADVLRAWGLGQAFDGSLRLRLSPKRLQIGESLQLEVHLRSSAAADQALVVDYAVHHVKANGSVAPKVFKGWQLVIAPGQRCALQKSHALRVISTRSYYPGRHQIDLLINGEVRAQAAFVLRD